jgi:tetratricopeptide (TPR) repeat protein
VTGVALLLGGSLSGSSCGREATTDQTAVAQAPAVDEDLSRLRAAHESRPDDPEASLALALHLYDRDNASREAQLLLDGVSRRQPERRDVHLKLLDSYLAAADSSAVSALLARLGSELDRDERFAFDATYVLLARRQVPEAKALWTRIGERVQEALRNRSQKPLPPAADQALRLRFAETLFVQGLLTAQMGQKEEALRLLREADEHGFPPLDSPLMERAADCLFELQEFALATQAYREVVKHRPENTRAHLRLALSLYSSGQVGAAGANLEQLLRQAPTLAQAHYYLGAVRFDQKRTAEAETHLRQELTLDPHCFRCLAKLAHLAYLNGDDEQCRSWLDQAAALDPDHEETHLVYGMLENRTGRFDQAIQHLSRIVEQSPKNTLARYQLALAYQRSGNAQKAREHRAAYDKLIQEEKARTLGVRGSGT